ncbi:phosphatase PAP2 family protein [Microbacterium sp. NIBRBAC000506063]|uniref:phosphatase PAP2 family protein n=1 Tax=Microbacterium sp. NIBRBAC000506063 TaxID=2734618 RepID=UPI001BB4F8FE|nr:phosphatase PAP2 family protein [Microbacterium sp. NIBRBAC000506063]QTV79099.1 phosphatase PAP2 family protein [Microbacterium sp. NIBRBAC000506063]
MTWGTAAGAVIIALFLSVLANPATPWFVAVDTAWHAWVVSLRTDALTAFEIGVDIATGGPVGGSVLMIVPLAVLLVLRRWWAALYYGLGVLLAGTLSQIAKHLVARERPLDGLWHVDFGSFPSGHMTTFTFFIVAMWVLLPRRWAVIAGSVLLVHEVFNRTYLGAHWLSDTVAGLALGAAVALLLWAAFARRIARQPRPKMQPADAEGARA